MIGAEWHRRSITWPPLSYTIENFEESLKFHRQSLVAAGRILDKRVIAKGFVGSARILIDHGDPIQSAKLLGAAEPLVDAIAAGLSTEEQTQFEDSKKLLVTKIGRAKFAKLFEQGRGLDIQQAIEVAIAEKP